MTILQRTLPWSRLVLAMCSTVLIGCGKEEKPLPMPVARPTLSNKIESFTGAHTRIVWSECADVGDSDTMANSDNLVLMGLDTQDGLGARPLQEKPGNYARPLLNSDGTCILWTDKNVSRKGGKKRYRPVIYLTGWKGGRPIRIGEGYAVDCWLDPATGVEWVYAVQDLRVSKAIALQATKLVRFPLHDVEKVETIYDTTPITPDNVQFSRDGTRASALFPWPHAGLLRLVDGKWVPGKLAVGCWTSMAPDNSGVMWAMVASA
ncbi:MAG: hypothetical protein ACOYMN_11495, partial [Roseimicrobium sp.]